MSMSLNLIGHSKSGQNEDTAFVTSGCNETCRLSTLLY